MSGLRENSVRPFSGLRTSTLPPNARLGAVMRTKFAMSPAMPLGRSSASRIASALCIALCGCGGDESVRPNLVLITIDALRSDVLSCYGGSGNLGDGLCEVAETGSRFVWAFSPAPSGAPAAASVMTSRYPSDHGVSPSAATFLRQDVETLAELLREADYATAAFVSSPELNRSRNLQQGFDLFDDRLAARPPTPGPGLGDAVIAWISGARPPWFTWVHFSEPHSPLANDPFNDSPGAYRAGYDDAVRLLDRRVSQLIAVMDAQPKRPAILVTALHGQALGDGEGPSGHGHSLELDQIRVPLLWRPARAGAGRSVGRRITTPVSLVDIAPTLLDAAGVPRPRAFAGQKLPYSDASPSSPRGMPPRTILAEHPDEVAMIHGDEYIAVARRPGTGQTTGVPPMGRSVRLPRGENGLDERLPEYDSNDVRADRLARLQLELMHAVWLPLVDPPLGDRGADPPPDEWEVPPPAP